MEDRIKHMHMIVCDLQMSALPCVKVKEADHVIIHAQCLKQFLIMLLLLFLLLLLTGTVQKEPLIEQFSVLLKELNITHHMQKLPILMLDAVFYTDAVPFFLKPRDTLPEPLLILSHDRIRNHVKSFREHLLMRFVSQDIERRSVNPDDTCSVQRMAEDSAVHTGENRLQRMILPDDLLFIGTLLSHVNRDPDCTHHTPVQIIQRRLISRQKLGSITGHHRLLRYERLLLAHDLPLRLDTGRIVELHIPDIRMPASFYLLLRLIDRLAEAIIDLLMYPVLILIPDQIRDMIDRCFKEMAGLPVILLCLTLPKPPENMKSALGVCHRHRPYIMDLLHIFFQ